MGASSVVTDHPHDAILVCDACGAAACATCGACSVCPRRVLSEDGVLRLLDCAHPFYEGAYQAQIHFPDSQVATLKGRLLLPFISFGYVKALIERVPSGARLLELGCGGGMRLAASRYHVTAVDLSLASLRATPTEYRHRIQADVNRLDFQPESFDAIAASCFWEHFTPAEKERLLRKFSIWLKPGGLLIFLFDTASQNPAFRWFRRFPELYKECFIDHDGHVGLETVSDNETRFANHGMMLVEGIGLNRTIQHLPVFVWMAPYARVSVWAAAGARFGRWLYDHPRSSQCFSAGVHAWDLSLGRLFPRDWSRLFMGVWRKA
jgi:SAM-dependent methyltransferase